MAYAAFVLSFLALGFTIFSFWWLHARTGKLRGFHPTSWSGYVDKARSVVRLPVTLQNTGAAPIVVHDMRLYFPECHAALQWEWTHETVEPVSNEKGGETPEVHTPFVVPGRSVHRSVAAMVGELPSVVPEGRPYVAEIHVKTGDQDTWVTTVRFKLNLANWLHPRNYISYTNLPNYLTEDELQAGADERAKLREQWGISAAIVP